jgi:signal transduction histidine kinase
MYQLILFNIVQNAVKYNKYCGEIAIVTDCQPISQQVQLRDCGSAGPHTEERGDKCFMLETYVIDTGIGIEEERRQMLFIPFLELKIKQSLKKVMNNNIGMGLACS